MMQLKDKKVLVTGGSRGIGRAIAIELGKWGARVVVHANKNIEKAEELAQEIGNGSIALKADLMEPAEIKSMIETVKNELGNLDAVVNNAGIALLSDLDSDDVDWIKSWSDTMRVNVEAMAYITKLTLPIFKAQNSGIYVNISSRAAHRGDTPEYLAYGASKGAILSLTKTIARYYGKHNIVAFALCPGFTKTDMAQDFINKYGEDYALHDIALNQLTQPEDIAPLVAFLASGKANHATGTTIDINAGSYVH